MNPASLQKSAGKHETAGSQGYEKIKAVKNVRLPAWCWWPQAAEQRGGGGELGMGRLTGVVCFPRCKVGLCDGHTPCGGNSPLSMK